MELIKHVSENDYEFHAEPNGFRSCWITVKNMSVYLVETDEGIVLEVYPLGCEFEDSLMSTYVFFDEAQFRIDEQKREEEMWKKAQAKKKGAR